MSKDLDLVAMLPVGQPQPTNASRSDGRMTEAQVDTFLGGLRKTLLAATNYTLSVEYGMRRIDRWDEGVTECAPNGSMTLTLRLNGGARDSEGDILR